MRNAEWRSEAARYSLIVLSYSDRIAISDLGRIMILLMLILMIMIMIEQLRC
jgi:hypothetical protein